jgi:hypothetical protein
VYLTTGLKREWIIRRELKNLMQISWPEVATISAIVSVIAFFERALTRYSNRGRQRKKLLVYKVFEGEQDLTAEQILRKLHTAALRHDLEGEQLFVHQSLWHQWRYRIKKIRNRIAASITTQTYSVRSLSQLEPLLYELIQEGMLKTDGERYFRNR